MKKTRILAAIFCLLVCNLAPGKASIRLDDSSEQEVGKIVGTLLDAYDARVAHAPVRVESAKFKWEGESDEAGDFSAAVPAGSYRIYVNANGFRRFESAFLKVKANTSEMVNIHLEILTIVDTVTVKPKKKRP
jgi:hypothetical protein